MVTGRVMPEDLTTIGASLNFVGIGLTIGTLCVGPVGVTAPAGLLAGADVTAGANVAAAVGVEGCVIPRTWVDCYRTPRATAPPLRA
ncbi:MAG TPA: hypothetical protein VKX96_16255 [Chloroflexota bacterium]|nr:hypothetical protein [Chloroflexota bacterium]